MASRPLYVDPDASGVAVFLGPTESQLMDLAWKHGALTVKQALALMEGQNPPAYTTVMTILGRLTAKGLLTRLKRGRTFVYSATIDKQTFLSERVSLLLMCLERNFPQML
jgi:predicted transcriptional regulator